MSRAQLSVGSMGFGVCARCACCLAQRKWLCQSSCGMLVVPVARSGGPNGHGLFNHAVVIWSMAGMVGGYGIASVLGNSSRNSNQIAVGRCQALPITVLRCLSELGHLLFCVKSSGNPLVILVSGEILWFVLPRGKLSVVRLPPVPGCLVDV